MLAHRSSSRLTSRAISCRNRPKARNGPILATRLAPMSITWRLLYIFSAPARREQFSADETDRSRRFPRSDAQDRQTWLAAFRAIEVAQQTRLAAAVAPTARCGRGDR